ncbi:MAG: signal peptidase II [Bacteroidota bacterium]
MRVLYVSLVIVLIDQITKLFVKGFSIPFLNINVRGLNYAERHDVIGSFFRITFVENPGMAFGIDPGLSSKLFLSLFSVVASVAIIYYLFRIQKENIKLRLSLALILGGAVGNLIDRVFYGVFYGYAPLFYGKVVDFLDLDFFDISVFGYVYDRWPIFNVADMAVSIGVVMLIIFSNKQQEEKSPAQVTDGGSDSQPLTANTPLTDEKYQQQNDPGNNDKSDNGKEI